MAKELRLVAAVLVAAASACTSPIVGHWTRDLNSPSPPVAWHETLDINGDGTATLILVGFGPCRGTQTFGGATWTATASSVTFSAASRCDGQIDCGNAGSPALGSGCVNTEWEHVEQGEHPYGLSSNNALLTLVGAGRWVRHE